MGAAWAWLKNTGKIFKTVCSAIISISLVGGGLLWIKVSAQDRVKEIARDTAIQAIDSMVAPLKGKLNETQFMIMKMQAFMETMADEEIKAVAESKFKHDSTVRAQALIDSKF